MHSILTVSYCLHSEKAVFGALFSTNLMPSSNFNRNLLWKCGNMACGMNTRNWLEAVPWACLDCSSHKESHLAMLMQSSRSASQKSGWEVGSLNCAVWVNAYLCYRYTLNRFGLFFLLLVETPDFAFSLQSKTCTHKADHMSSFQHICFQENLLQYLLKFFIYLWYFSKYSDR